MVILLLILYYLSKSYRQGIHVRSVHGNETIEKDIHQNDIPFIRTNGERLSDLGLSPSHKLVEIYDPKTGKKRLIHGRFLHITDMHPDSLYEAGTSMDQVCHYGKPKGKGDTALKFGTAMGGCDSSMDLIEHTLRWIGENLRDEIDFVVWTGDNIRHDNDRKNPRTEFEIFDMNELIAGRMETLFGSQESDDPREFDVNVIPSLGNNDVFPHNMFSLGPTLQTREVYNIWNNFIPQEQRRFFGIGASFLTEVIPGKLAVLSINTLYLFKANPLVDNCNSRKEPGYTLLVWLGNTLQEFRKRGMKVWLTGHVPPLEKNFESSCYNKFTLWTHEYRDIIIGGLYGHMNVDHFIPVDGKKARRNINIPKNVFNNKDTAENEDDADEIFLQHADPGREVRLMGAKPVNKETYMKGVRDKIYKKVHDKLASVKAENAARRNGPRTVDDIYERYSIVNIAGSIIPTFNPSFRVWEYNITDLDINKEQQQFVPWDEFFSTLEKEIQDSDDMQDIDNSMLVAKKKKRVDKTIPKKMPKNASLGPAYTPQLFTPTKFIQYYADLKNINKNYYKLIEAGETEQESAEKAFGFHVEYTSEDEPYSMKSLLVKDYLELASNLTEDRDIWKLFKEKAFISSGYDEDLDG